MKPAHVREMGESWEPNAVRFLLPPDGWSGGVWLSAWIGGMGVLAAAQMAVMWGEAAARSDVDAMFALGLVSGALFLAQVVLAGVFFAGLYRRLQLVEVRIGPDAIRLGGRSVASSEVERVELVRRAFCLRLRSGACVRSRRVSPRDPERVLRLLHAALVSEADAAEHAERQTLARARLAALRQVATS